MLTKEQIKILENYCIDNGVVYYDLEQEIVDHLAAVIETGQAQSLDKSFEEILEEKAPEFSKDWKMIEVEKRKALRREYFKEFGKEFESYLTIPKIAITIAATICTYFLIHCLYRKNDTLNVISLLFNMSGLVVNLSYKKRIEKAKTIKEERSRNLICYNIYRRLNVLYISVAIIYFLALSSFSYLYGEKHLYTTARIILILYPVFFVSIFSYHKVRCLFLSKMKTNYPLAFQS